MPKANETDLITFEGWTFRARPALKQPARFLLLMHGFKDDENAMWMHSDGLPDEYHMITPRGLYEVENGGYSWRPRQGDSASAGPVPSNDDYLNLLSCEMFETSIVRLIRLVEEYGRQVGVDASQFDMMGFSQGGIMTYLTMLTHPQRVRKAAILGAFLPKNVDDLIAAHPLEGRQVFISHGTLDEKVPLERAQRSMRLLEQAGAQITYCEDRVGHEVSPKCRQGLKLYLSG